MHIIMQSKTTHEIRPQREVQKYPPNGHNYAISCVV